MRPFPPHTASLWKTPNCLCGSVQFWRRKKNKYSSCTRVLQVTWLGYVSHPLRSLLCCGTGHDAWKGLTQTERGLDAWVQAQCARALCGMTSRAYGRDAHRIVQQPDSTSQKSVCAECLLVLCFCCLSSLAISPSSGLEAALCFVSRISE